jgi:uncharacterized protein YkuJ
MKLISLTFMSVLASATTAFAKNAGHVKLERFDDVKQVIEQVVEKHGAQRVLVALDIDNTTMATEKDLGSEHWFMWQAKLLEEQPGSPDLVAHSIEQMLDLQGLIYAVAPMHAVERDIPVYLKSIGERGAKTMALTSRNLDTHDSTLRELQRNGFPYDRFSPDRRPAIVERYVPYDVNFPERSGISHQDITEFKLEAAKPVFWDRGVMLTQGQNKGIMLKTLLHKLHADFDAIVFIDDREKHSVNMQAVFEHDGVEVTTVQYVHEAEKIKRFNESDKLQAISDWKMFDFVLRNLSGISR